MELRPFEADQEADLQQLLESDPVYTERASGLPPAPSDALSLTLTRPEGVGSDHKHVLGAWRPGWGGRDELVAVVDLIRGYPDRQCSTVGLLLVRWELQGTGVGRETWQSVERMVAGWTEIERFRLAVVETVARAAVPFWRAMGFHANGEQEAMQIAGRTRSVMIMEKAVAPEPGGPAGP